MKTTNYDQFILIEGNRNLNEGHIRKLEKSILKVNMLPFFPIKVNSKMEVVDGQHRLEVAKRNNLEIYYEEIPKGSLAEVILLNANVKPWAIVDYLESYIKQGYVEYIALQNFMERHGLGLAISLQLLNPAQRKSKNLHEFKLGRFQITNRENAEIMAERLNELKPYSEADAWKHRELISALEILYKSVKHSRFIYKLSLSGMKITRKSTNREYLRMFEDILNFKMRSSHIVRLY